MNQGDVLNYTYRLIEPIGHGGLGTIWLGYHENLQKYVVVKKVHDRFTDLVNCRIEVDILKSLRHQYLPQVYDFIETQEGIFTVMDYIPGQDLQHYLDQGYVFDENQLLFWLRQLAEVLSYLHSRTPKIIHCDIKPANIMVTESGDICLIDFNISLDGENSKDLVGVSSQYAAPEQIERAQMKLRGIPDPKAQVDERSDLYSLGAVFYRLMSGQLPEVRRSQGWTLKAMGVPYSSSIVNIVDDLMEDIPVKRTRSAAQLLQQLDHLEKQSDEARKKRRALTIGSIAAGIAVVLLSGILTIVIHQKNEQDFFQAFDTYMSEAEQIANFSDNSQYLEALVADGRKILNDPGYQDDFKKYTGEKARVLLAVGQGEMLLEHNISALSYLEDAAKNEASDPAIYRDLAIVSARSGDMAQAENYLSQASLLNISQADRLLVEAEFLYQKGDPKGAYELAKQAALDVSATDNLMMHAATLALKLAGETGAWQDGASFCRSMSKKTLGPVSGLWLRQTGIMTIKAAQAGTVSLISEGTEAYDELIASGYGTYTDYLNLAWLYETAGQLDQAKSTLLGAELAYPDQYEVYLQLSYVSYQIARDTTRSQRNYEDTRTYYNKALELYTAQGHSVSENADLLAMEQIIRELVTGGWLKP